MGDLSPECQGQLLSTFGYSCAQHYRAHHHFPQENGEWDIMVLKFQIRVYRIKSIVSLPSSWKLRYYKMDVQHSDLQPAATWHLKLKSSMMSSLFQAWPYDLPTAASNTSLLPIGMRTPVAYIETRGGGCSWLWEMSFVAAKAVAPFSQEATSPIKVIISSKQPLKGFETLLWEQITSICKPRSSLLS